MGWEGGGGGRGGAGREIALLFKGALLRGCGPDRYLLGEGGKRMREGD